MTKTQIRYRSDLISPAHRLVCWVLRPAANGSASAQSSMLLDASRQCQLKGGDLLRGDPRLIKVLHRTEISGGHNVAKGVVVEQIGQDPVRN